jgi:nucleoside-diphosphate-sugar epimerase
VRCPDLSTARTQLGWSPHTPTEEGLKRTVKWMAQALASRRLGADAGG